MADFILAAEFIIAAIFSIIVISNPISTTAVFISLTDGFSHDDRIAVIKKAMKYAFLILVFFAISGLLLFELFGFTIGAFRIAGGILLLSFATTMLDTKQHAMADDDYRDISIIPLAIPFTSGPGTIVAVVVLMSEALHITATVDFTTGLLCIAGVFIGISMNIIVAYYMLSRSEKVDGILKEGGRKVITKLLGLIVMAIAIQFIINGIFDIIPDIMEIVRQNSNLLNMVYEI